MVLGQVEVNDTKPLTGEPYWLTSPKPINNGRSPWSLLRFDRRTLADREHLTELERHLAHVGLFAPAGFLF